MEERGSRFSLSRRSKSPIKPGTSGKRPRSSMDAYAQMICPICKEYFTRPIVQCSKGHSVCLSCVHHMLQISKDERCPECRSHMQTTCRNYSLEAQMQYITIGCVWDKLGCTAQVALIDRTRHEAYCPNRPLMMKCYYNTMVLGDECGWEGNPMLLPKHLREVHGIKPIKAYSNTIECVLQLPQEDTFAASFQVLKSPIAKYGKATSKCILEFLYFKEDKIAFVTIKSLEKEFSPRCKVRLCDMGDEFNGPSNVFDLPCLDSTMTSYRLSDLPIKHGLMLPYMTLRAYSRPKASSSSFTLRVDFPSQSSQNSD